MITKIVVTASNGMFGPYESVEVTEDRLIVGEYKAHLPFTVIGEYQIVESDLSPFTDLSNYIWNGTEVIPKPEPFVDGLST